MNKLEIRKTNLEDILRPKKITFEFLLTWDRKMLVKYNLTKFEK